MPRNWAELPQTSIRIHTGQPSGPLETWRHTIGHGGINALPLPERVVEGARRLKPRLLRVFLQEHFRVYPERGRFDWSRLDPYMDALARTGAKVVAAITLKPPALFPRVDQAVWRPNDPAEWQRLLSELVHRYSAARPIVTHWEVGNETDIGESGGAPYLIPMPDDYAEFYATAVRAIRAAFPAAKVGGPASCWVDNEPLPGLVRICAREGLPLDFISWHLYSDDPARHALGVEKAKALLAGFPGKRPEMLVTEWSKGFDPVTVEETAFDPRRAAITAASILAMADAGVDGSFYYHLWDQTFYRDAFAPFFSPRGLDGMAEHWNEKPHRFGLFGVNGEVRPQYFVFWMLARLGEERLAVEYGEPALRVLASRGEGGKVSALVVNLAGAEPAGRILWLRFAGLRPGPKTLTTYRIDERRAWSEETLELLTLERREVDTTTDFACPALTPGDTVTLVELSEG